MFIRYPHVFLSKLYVSRSIEVDGTAILLPNRFQGFASFRLIDRFTLNVYTSYSQQRTQQCGVPRAFAPPYNSKDNRQLSRFSHALNIASQEQTTHSSAISSSIRHKSPEYELHVPISRSSNPSRFLCSASMSCWMMLICVCRGSVVSSGNSRFPSFSESAAWSSSMMCRLADCCIDIGDDQRSP